MSEQQKTLTENLSELTNKFDNLSNKFSELAMKVEQNAAESGMHAEPFIITGLTVFVLACFVGYHVVWRVTPALHSPLMAITNAISSVIIVGAILATGTVSASGFASFLGFLAVMFASINIFGGFVITKRMLHMFKKKG